MKNISPILIDYFYHDGRGPELQKVIWEFDGKILSGFEYYNPDDVYDEANLKYLKLDKVEAFSMSSDEVHGNILAKGKSKAAIFRVLKSEWKKSLNPTHLSDCEHFQIMFYDEIYDVICKSITAGEGKLTE